MSATPTNPQHQAVVRAFGEAVKASDGAAYIWLDRENYLWHVRAETPDGMHRLTTPNGEGFPRLEGLLQVLAGVGVTRILVEYEGFPPVFYDRIN